MVSIDETLMAVSRIEHKLEQIDGLFHHSPERNDIKTIVDFILQYRDFMKQQLEMIGDKNDIR